MMDVSTRLGATKMGDLSTGWDSVEVGDSSSGLPVNSIKVGWGNYQWDGTAWRWGIYQPV